MSVMLVSVLVPFKGGTMYPRPQHSINPVGFDRVDCRGDEQSIFSCSYVNATRDTCMTGSLAVVECLGEPITVSILMRTGMRLHVHCGCHHTINPSPSTAVNVTDTPLATTTVNNGPLVTTAVNNGPLGTTTVNGGPPLGITTVNGGTTTLTITPSDTSIQTTMMSAPSESSDFNGLALSISFPIGAVVVTTLILAACLILKTKILHKKQSTAEV